MRAMFAGFGAIILIAIVAHFGLGQAGFSSSEKNTSASVRLN